MKMIETYCLRQTGDITRREDHIRGGDELPQLTVSVTLGTPPLETAKQLRRLAAALERRA